MDAPTTPHSVTPTQREAWTSFVHHFAHDLRNPCGSILGSIETVLDPDMELSRPEMEELLSMALGSVLRLQGIVSDALVFAHLTLGQLDTAAVSLATTWEAARRRVFQGTGSPGEWVCDEGIPPVRGDEAALEALWVTLFHAYSPARSFRLAYCEGEGGVLVAFTASGTLRPQGADSPLDAPAPDLASVRIKGQGLGTACVYPILRLIGAEYSFPEPTDDGWCLFLRFRLA